jgi:hypothetical protein
MCGPSASIDSPNIKWDGALLDGQPWRVIVTPPTAPDTTQFDKLNPPPATGIYPPTTFAQLYADVKDIAADVAPGIPEGWTNLGIDADSAMQNFQNKIAQADASADNWTGAAYNAMQDNLANLYKALDPLVSGAPKMSTVTSTHATMTSWIRETITENYPGYFRAINDPNFSQYRNAIVQNYNTFAQQVLQIFNDKMFQIQQYVVSLPLYGGPPPQVGSLNTTAPGGPGAGLGPATATGAVPKIGTGGGGGGGGGVPKIGTGGGVPNIPMPSLSPSQSPATLASNPTTPQTPSSLQTPAGLAAPTASPASDPTSALDQAAMPLGEAGQSLGQSLGQAMGAAQQAGNKAGALSAASKLPPLKPGALSKDLKGGGGRVGGGVGAPSSAISKPAAGAPSAAAATSGRTIPAASRAGLSSAAGNPAAGAPGAGAPGSGQHGAAAQGTPYQVNKALKRKNEDFTGDTEAVVAVLGEPERTDAAKPEAT